MILDQITRCGKDAFDKFCEALIASGQGRIVQDYLKPAPLATTEEDLEPPSKCRGMHRSFSFVFSWKDLSLFLAVDSLLLLKCCVLGVLKFVYFLETEVMTLCRTCMQLVTVGNSGG